MKLDHVMAKSRGLKLIRFGVGEPGSNLYKFLACGHEQVAPGWQVRASGISCKQCFAEQLRAAGLKLINSLPGVKSKHYECLSCGADLLVSNNTLRSGAFVCPGCNPRGSGSGFVYLLKLTSTAGTSIYQLRVARAIGMNALQVLKRADISVELDAVLAVSDYRSALMLARELRERYSQSLIDPLEYPEGFKIGSFRLFRGGSIEHAMRTDSRRVEVVVPTNSGAIDLCEIDGAMVSIAVHEEFAEFSVIGGRSYYLGVRISSGAISRSRDRLSFESEQPELFAKVCNLIHSIYPEVLTDDE